MNKIIAQSIYDDLKKVIANPKCELDYNNMYELIIAVILSAQCTDKRVNIVTKQLFLKYPTVQDLAQADIFDVISIIKPLGFFNMKAKNIIACANDIVANYNGQVPNDMEELIKLHGVGRKTASVVLAEGYKMPAIAVDTHVNRVSNRIGLSNSKNVLDTEKMLKKWYKKEDWANVHSTLLLYGRYYCTAHKPQCHSCLIKDRCKYCNENSK